ncbi:MAG: mechanosensitive ion channel family protein [Roseivirga sp.]|nr:mechanosensitive ion channel family protein [Roseivirga sp.]
MKRVLLLVFAVSQLPVLLRAQDTLPERFSNPYEVIYNHLKYLQEEEYMPAQAAKSLYHSDLSEEELENLAIELKQILDGTGSYVALDDLPKSNNYYDSLYNKQRYVLFDEFPDVYVQKYGDYWYYSNKTVREIDALHKEVYPFGTDKLLNLLPKLGSKKYFGLHVWQLLGILALTILSFTFHKILTFFSRNLLVRLLHKYGKVDVARNYILPVARPLSWFVVFMFVKLLFPVLQLPAWITSYLIKGVDAVLPLFATIFFYKLVDVLSAYMEKLARQSENTLDDQLVPLVRKILKTFVIVVGIIAILKGFRFDIWPLLTGLSIGGLAFALAAQDTLKNLFGSLMIFVDRPFQIGDWVTSGDIDGTVEEVGFRSTRVRTFRDSVMYVPNSIISNSNVDNHGKRNYRRFYTKLSVTYDTPSRLIEVFVKGVERIVLAHPETRKDYYNIFLNDYAASSLDIMLYIFFDVPTWTDELRCRQEIMLEVNKLAEHLGVRFAFPTQTLMIEQMPGHKDLTPNYTQSGDEMSKQLDDYFGAQPKQPK